MRYLLVIIFNDMHRKYPNNYSTKVNSFTSNISSYKETNK